MKIVIPGVPVPQGRMRHAKRGNFVTTYDPKAKEKKEIREVLAKDKVKSAFNYPRVSFVFYMPIPKGIRKKEVALYESESLKHDKKPDVDNLIKLYLDCLDGIVLYGDQKVSLGACIKLYSPEPRTIVWVSETSDMISEDEIACFLLGEES